MWSEFDAFIVRLRQVISWTESLIVDFDYENGNYGTVLRQTIPSINGKLLYSIDIDYAKWNIDDYSIDNYKESLRKVIEVRENIPVKVYDIATSGRILCFTIGLTTHDGAAIIESKCFVDESDVPPIDTWFYLREKFDNNGRTVLFCWIPKKFEGTIQNAINVEMMESYKWLDEIKPDVYEQILCYP